MSDKNVLLEISDGVAKITIDNAEKRNPLNVPTVGELIEAFETAQNDDNVLVIVLTGAGDRAFCAGGDLKAGKDGGPFTGDISQPGHFVIRLFTLMEPATSRSSVGSTVTPWVAVPDLSVLAILLSCRTRPGSRPRRSRSACFR